MEDATIVPEVLAAQDWFARLIGGHNVLERRVPLVWLERQNGPAAGRGSVAAVPLYMGNQETGCIICFAGAQETFGDFHLDVLASLASQTAISIENASMYTRALDEKAKVETILAALHDGLLVTDSTGGLVHANPLAQRMLGFDSSSYGEDLHPLLSKSVSNSDLGVYSVAGALNAALLGVPVFGEMEVPGEAGGSFQANYVPLKDREGTVSGGALFLHDITEFKRLEQMRTDFVSNVSQELRTPLTSIVGYVSILLSGAVGELSRQQEEYLGVVSEQTANLTTMIEELLELSRMVAHGEGIKGEAVGISSVVETSMRQLGDQAEEKGVTVEVHIPESLPDVDGDAARLVHVLTNIISNAIKFTDRGGEIEVVALKNDACVQVQVSDSGCGISPSYLPHIFDRFFRAHAGTPNRSGGFGLGLAICREIIELHGGRIWAESQAGRGSTFYFTVPIREVGVSDIQP